MREILFRGKRVDNGEWVEGCLLHDSEQHESYIAEHFEDKSAYIRKVISETVGQYTGLTDKNGNKIFEGDIIDASAEWWNASGPAGHSTPIIEVEWDEFLCGFDPFANYDCDCDVYISANGCAIIGNIHDNPELLKGE